MTFIDTDEPQALRVIKLPAVEDKTARSRSAILRDEKLGLFPRSIPTGQKARGWVESEVDDWIREQMAKRDAEGAA